MPLHSGAVRTRICTSAPDAAIARRSERALSGRRVLVCLLQHLEQRTPRECARVGDRGRAPVAGVVGALRRYRAGLLTTYAPLSPVSLAVSSTVGISQAFGYRRDWPRACCPVPRVDDARTGDRRMRGASA